MDAVVVHDVLFAERRACRQQFLRIPQEDRQTGIPQRRQGQQAWRIGQQDNEDGVNASRLERLYLPLNILLAIGRAVEDDLRKTTD